MSETIYMPWSHTSAVGEEPLTSNYSTTICFLQVAHDGVNSKEGNDTVIIKDCRCAVNGLHFSFM